MPFDKADFEERTFDGAMNAELARDRGRVFSPGQVEEAVLGYDAAAVPDAAASRVLHDVAGVTLPRGAWLTPNWWVRCAARPDGSILPSRFASLLLQYKRPALWYGVSAPLWNAYGGPYLRYMLASRQHHTLVRLDEALNGEAIVRYAAPCTHRRQELEQWQIDRQVLEHTNFVSPRRIGLRHRAWTYRDPGGVGRRNEFRGDEDVVEAESVQQMMGLLIDRPGLSLAQHLEAILSRLGGEEADELLVAAVLDTGVESEEELQALLAGVRLRLIGLELMSSGVSWWLREL